MSLVRRVSEIQTRRCGAVDGCRLLRSTLFGLRISVESMCKHAPTWRLVGSKMKTMFGLMAHSEDKYPRAQTHAACTQEVSSKPLELCCGGLSACRLAWCKDKLLRNVRYVSHRSSAVRKKVISQSGSTVLSSTPAAGLLVKMTPFSRGCLADLQARKARDVARCCALLPVEQQMRTESGMGTDDH